MASNEELNKVESDISDSLRYHAFIDTLPAPSAIDHTNIDRIVGQFFEFEEKRRFHFLLAGTCANQRYLIKCLNDNAEFESRIEKLEAALEQSKNHEEEQNEQPN